MTANPDFDAEKAKAVLDAWDNTSDCDGIDLAEQLRLALAALSRRPAGDVGKLLERAQTWIVENKGSGNPETFALIANLTAALTALPSVGELSSASAGEVGKLVERLPSGVWYSRAWSAFYSVEKKLAGLHEIIMDQQFHDQWKARRFEFPDTFDAALTALSSAPVDAGVEELAAEDVQLIDNLATYGGGSHYAARAIERIKFLSLRKHKAEALLRGIERGEITPPEVMVDDSGTPTYPHPAKGWTCFFCGHTFHTAYMAAEHFGSEPTNTPKCVEAKREIERLSRQLTTERQATEKVRADIEALPTNHCAGYSECRETALAILAQHAGQPVAGEADNA